MLFPTSFQTWFWDGGDVRQIFSRACHRSIVECRGHCGHDIDIDQILSLRLRQHGFESQQIGMNFAIRNGRQQQFSSTSVK